MKYTNYLFIILITTLFNGCKSSVLEDLAEGSPTALHPQKITILKQVNITNISTIQEASDLAFDDETNTLYIVGDKGNLYVYDVNIENNTLNLHYQNKHKIYHPSETFTIDSEGLTSNNKNELIVSFEGTPRISSLSTEGKVGKNHILPSPLNNRNNYTTGNTMLESVAWHQDYGILTAAEFPLKGQDNTKQTIYALNGSVWHFKAEPYKDNAVTAIEVMEDDNLLILERAYKKGTIPSFYITLKKLYLNDCDEHKICKTQIIYSEKMNLKNYEGLTKIGKNRYLMVTDNQKKITTDFIYFEIK
ncbi:MAG TPA: esterase-like activity of phytase family protein [Sulfurovum sp.]|nr:esterase-like activity of phytase family protein [Sulfurovum sp.]